jgi:hypothetical protein
LSDPVESMSRLEKLEKYLSNDRYSKIFQILENQIGGYDFDSALKMIEKLAALITETSYTTEKME